MAIEQQYIDLINADIDGEINSDDKAGLDAFLLKNGHARALHEELAALCETIESLEPESPPPHLRHVITNAAKPARAAEESPGFLQMLFATPALKYSATFAAGVLLTLSAISSDQFSNKTLDDITGLVGTISEPVRGDLLKSIAVDNTMVAGKVSLRSAGSMLILDFDMVTSGPVEIQASYSGRTLWFNGFAQLENSGTTVSARSGSVSVGMEGKRRYAVYLQNEGKDEGVTIQLRFVAGGELVHETRLEYDPAK